MEKYPVLYSYRRCPYAMRARMAIAYSGIQVEQREIVFWEKPAEMLEASPKGTVPVLILTDGSVIDESRDIMLWALNSMSSERKSNSDQAWLFSENSLFDKKVNDWIDLCDNEFKRHLDHYKYADRFPEQSKQSYREQGCKFLTRIENQLAENSQIGCHSEFGLIENRVSMADIALFPFVRQFVNVDKEWFSKADYVHVKPWLKQNIESKWFTAIMKNRPVWKAGQQPLWVDEPELTNKAEFTAKANSKFFL
ncbi:glutathione S-transferase [Thiomicrorhabdus lithotrophica]|uniref:Glutathione S-transferase n=1 Tax=Thiomicrorhabdus lithotrophica TaxID=2949997 RepID=A0ABY8CAU2_9GAMM|nr:glutathione S-transferase [Thiomicrorhabdus lithotrophica]WEJ63064.1 glutathione S-transferase [Thiomicrorhabdus lithotrophica]